MATEEGRGGLVVLNNSDITEGLIDTDDGLRALVGVFLYTGVAAFLTRFASPLPGAVIGNNPFTW